MRQLLILLGLMLSPLVVLGKSIEFQVDGMVCAFCAQGIEKKLKAEKGVEEVKVDLESKFVRVTLAEGADLPETKITEVIKEAGYKIKSKKLLEAESKPSEVTN